MNPDEPDPREEQPKKAECEISHSLCAQCGCEMDLVKTKWICPKCHWIIGCCD